MRTSPYKEILFVLVFVIVFISILFSNIGYSLAQNQSSSSLQGVQVETPTSTPQIIDYPSSYLPPLPEPSNITVRSRVLIPIVAKPFKYDVSKSIYIQSPTTTWDLGCTVGTEHLSLPYSQNSFVILAYGNTNYRDNKYGIWTYGSTFIDMNQMEASVKSFIQGYIDCSEGGKDGSEITVAVGTNNWNSLTVFQQSNNVISSHGNHFGMVITNIHNWLSNNNWHFIKVVGAIDIETDPQPLSNFAAPNPTKQWINGYNITSVKELYNFGIADCSIDYPADGGPSQQILPAPCGPPNSGSLWTQEEILRVSYSTGVSYPFPEIYNTGGHNASQWYRVGVYAYRRWGIKMLFRGALAQYTACYQRPDDCTCDVINTPKAGFEQLLKLVFSNPYVFSDMKWASDIYYQNDPITQTVCR